jgi:hypothetical protein
MDGRLLVCPACNEVLVGRLWWDVPEEKLEIVYPARTTHVAGLPSEIEKAYDSALQVRSIDENAFAVLLGRVLDKVCLDRGAEGKSLYERISSLAEKDEIPPRLSAMAHQLRQLRNIGAHADLGELTPREVPILHNLCNAILTYVYTGPSLVAQVEQRLRELRGAHIVKDIKPLDSTRPGT